MTLQKSISPLIRSGCYGLFISTGVWLVLLLHAAVALHEKSAGISSVVFGPLVLNTLAKQQNGDTTTASISMNSGMLGYLMIWVGMGLVIGVVRHHIDKRRVRNEK